MIEVWQLTSMILDEFIVTAPARSNIASTLGTSLLSARCALIALPTAIPFSENAGALS